MEIELMKLYKCLTIKDLQYLYEQDDYFINKITPTFCRRFTKLLSFIAYDVINNNKDVYVNKRKNSTHFYLKEIGYKDIIGNENTYNKENPNDAIKNVYYTFTLKVEGRDEIVLPIMDFKHDDKLFNKLLNGESITLTQNYYMAMGDNTGNSYDSRYFGYVSENRIRGELLIRWWPLNRLGLLN